jgi:hypothetical protein
MHGPVNVKVVTVVVYKVSLNKRTLIPSIFHRGPDRDSFCGNMICRPQCSAHRHKKRTTG